MRRTLASLLDISASRFRNFLLLRPLTGTRCNGSEGARCGHTTRMLRGSSIANPQLPGQPSRAFSKQEPLLQFYRVFGAGLKAYGERMRDYKPLFQIDRWTIRLTRIRNSSR